MPNWSAVIFDMDGLMLDTEALARRAWDRAMADWGLVIPDGTYVKLIGRRVDDVRDIIAREMGTGVPFDVISQRKSEYVEEEIAKNGIPIKPGLTELLDWLDEHRIPRAVASSTHRPTLVRKLALAGIADRCSTIVCGDEITRGKPAPDIFLAAAGKLGVGPKECIVLEDSEPGIIAADAAGMIPILVPDLGEPSSVATNLAYRVLPSLAAVRSMFEENRGQFTLPDSRLTNPPS